MRKITCMLLLIQSGFMIAQTKTVVTQNGEKVAISTGANNGLTATNGYIQLGGALTQPSVLTTTSAFTLAIQGLQAGAASDNVLVSDANGVLKYVPRTSFSGADNLGNHTATQNLDMSSKNILNIANAYIKNEAQILDRTTSNTNYFGIYKNNGLFGIWNNLKNANALTIDETTSKTTLTSAQIAKGTDGSTPAIGSVAVAADTNGNVKWVPASSIGAGDNLGNHTATTDLTMSGKNINNAANVTATGTVSAADITASTKATVQTAQITKGSDGLSPALGSVAVAADTNGNVKWVSASTIGAGDNLGNHTATTDLTMSGKNINNAANVTATGTVSTANVTASTKATVQTAQIIKGSDGLSPAIGSVAVAADTNGNVKWTNISSILPAAAVTNANNGLTNNSGTIQLGGALIKATTINTTSSNILEINSGGTSSSPVSGFKIVDGTQGQNKVLTSDANGKTRWEAAGITLGQGVLGGGANIANNLTTSSSYVYTNAYVVLPPGRWLVTVNMLLAKTGNAFTASNEFWWVRTTFSNSSTTYSPSSDIQGSNVLVSGGLNPNTNYGLMNGSVTIQNNTASNKTYYFMAGYLDGQNRSSVIANFGSYSWGENSIVFQAVH